MLPKKDQPATEAERTRSSDSAEDFASIRDQSLLPSPSPPPPSSLSRGLDGSVDGQSTQVMQRLSGQDSNLSAVETALSGRDSAVPQPGSAQSSQSLVHTPVPLLLAIPNVLESPPLALIRQTAPVSPLMSATTTAFNDDSAIHSYGSLSIVSTEAESSAPVTSRWAATSAAAAAALASAAAPQSIRTAPVGISAPSLLTTVSSDAVLTLQESCPRGYHEAQQAHTSDFYSQHSRSSALSSSHPTRRPCSSPLRSPTALRPVMCARLSNSLPTNSAPHLFDGQALATRRATPPPVPRPSPRMSPGNAHTGLTVTGVTSDDISTGTKPSTTPAAAAPFTQASLSTLVLSAPPPLAEAHQPSSGSVALPASVPRRKLRDSEVSFSMDFLHTAPSAPLALAAEAGSSRGDVSPSFGDGHHGGVFAPTGVAAASPGAQSLSVRTSACVVSPMTAALAGDHEPAKKSNETPSHPTPPPQLERGGEGAADGVGGSSTSPPTPGMASAAGARTSKAPHPPLVCVPPHAPVRHGSITGSAFAGVGASTSSSKVTSVSSATSSVACLPSIRTHYHSLEVGSGAPVPPPHAHTNDTPLSHSEAVSLVSPISTTVTTCRGAARRARRATSSSATAASTTHALASADTTLASGIAGTLTTGTHSTDEGLLAAAAVNTVDMHSRVGLGRDSNNDSGRARSALSKRDGSSGRALLLNRHGGDGNGADDEVLQWASSSASGVKPLPSVVPTRRVFLPMNVVVTINLIVTVVVVALLAILPLNDVSMRTIHYVTSVLGKGLASSFAASTEANLFFLPLSLRSFIALWMLDQKTQFRPWTRDDMPTMMRGICNLIRKTSANSHLLYVGLYSPYSGYGAYCSPQYFNGTAMYGNYIINNESEPRYLIGPDANQVEPRVALEEVYPMTPWEEAVEFGAPNNSWYNVAVPWYKIHVKHAAMASRADVADITRPADPTTHADPTLDSAHATEANTGGKQLFYTTIAAIAEGWWINTIGNVSVITYSWPFIDYMGNLAMFTAALQPDGFYNLLAQSLRSASLGRAMVFDPITGMVLVSSWREAPEMRMDNWKWDQCVDCHTSDILYVDQLGDSLMEAAVSALGGRQGIFDKPHSVSVWEQSFRYKRKSAKAFAQRILFKGQTTSKGSRTMLHLVLIYAIEQSEYASNVQMVRTAIFISVALTLAIIAVMDIALIYLFIRPLQNLAAGLRDAAQLRDGSSVVASRISAITEVASMQRNFFLMNQQLMQMKAFVPQGVLGPMASAWSDSERGTDHASECGHDDSFVFFSGPRPVDSGEVSSVSANFGRAKVGGGATGAGARPPAQSPPPPREDFDDKPLPFEQDALVSAACKGADTHAATAAESLRLNERALFDEVNRFRRRYCTVMVACMHICERDLVNQPKMELLISMFMNAAIPVILKDGGVIESQRPDTLVVSFGAHNRMAMHQTRGARCALEIIHRVNEYPPLGARVGCMVDVGEYYVGTFGAAQRNARVTYGVRTPSSLELVKLYKSLNTQILLSQKLAASLDRQFLVMPIDSLLFTLESKSRILYELRGSVRSLPVAIHEAHARSVIKAARYGFNKMVHGDYEGALRYLEPFAQQDEQIRRLASACRSLLQRGVTKPYIRSIGRIKLSETNVLYDVEEYEQVRQSTALTEVVPTGVTIADSPASAAAISLTPLGGVGGFTAMSSAATGASKTPSPGMSFTSRQYLQRVATGSNAVRSPTTRSESTAGAAANGMHFPSSVSPVDPMLEVAIRRQHNKKGLRIIAGASPIDDELAANAGLDLGTGTVAVAVADSTTSSPHNADDATEAGALFEMFIDADDGDEAEMATLASTTHTVTEDAIGTSSSCSVGTTSEGLLVQASAAPSHQEAQTGNGDRTGQAATANGAGGDNVGDLPTILEDYEGNIWFRSADRLGEGAFSVVYRGLSASGNLVALKCFQLLSRNVDYEVVSEEVRLFASLHHENIVQYVSVYISDNFFVEIMELVPGGSLDALLKSFGHVQKRALRRFLRDILRGLQYLHSMNIVHCDVKPHNVLLAMDGQCKLSDFGSAMSRATTSLHQIEDVLDLRGTPAYLAPEVARGEIPTMKSDVFSLGITILELLDGALPWRLMETAGATEETHAGAAAVVAEDASDPLHDVLGAGCVDAGTTTPRDTPDTRLTPQEKFRRMWLRPAVAAVLENHPLRTEDGPSRSGSCGDHEATLGSAEKTHPEGCELSKRLFPRFQRRETCAPNTCPLIDDLKGLVGRGPSSDASLDNSHTHSALGSSTPAFGSPRRGPSGPPATIVPHSQGGAARVTPNKGDSSCEDGSATRYAAAGYDGVFSGQSRPVAAEVTADGLTLDHILRSPTHLIQSIANGVVMPYIADDLATDDELVDFLRLCLHPDATQRASADELLNHSWLM